VKLPVSKTFDGDEWICFDEEDIRVACANLGCEEDVEECVEQMKSGGMECIECFVELCNMETGKPGGYQAVGSIRPAAREKGRE
jgi:hypothetical protein